MKLSILGAGAWGTALGIALAARHDVTLWCRDARQQQSLTAERVNRRYLPGAAIPASVRITDDIGVALADCELVVAAIPTAALRQTLRTVAAARCSDVVWLCKGFETGSAKFPHQVAVEELGPAFRYGALSGPSFADEVARGLPAAVTLASRDADFAASAGRELHTGRLRVYSSDDLPGVETGGAVKNVIAIGAGMADQLALGDNAKALLITRGLAEMMRLVLMCGAAPSTTAGLAGIGDLLVTCASPHSRNHRLGAALARGAHLDDALRDIGMVAEGVYASRAAHALALHHQIELPVFEHLYRVLHQGLPVERALAALMANVDDRALRIMGLVSMVIGTVLLYLVH